MVNTIEDYGDYFTAVDIITGDIDGFEDSNLLLVANDMFENCNELTNVDLPAVTSIGLSAFDKCSQLKAVNLPLVTSADDNAFSNCPQLTEISLPAATNIGNVAFAGCVGLTEISLPAATSIGGSAFLRCSQLTSISLPAATSIGMAAFAYCSNLTKVILGNTSGVATLANTNAFMNAPNAIIYVPDELVDSYKSATNWSTYADRIIGISELPDQPVEGIDMEE
jgi:hypothetical protein